MSFSNIFDIELGNDVGLYAKLLREEDFDFGKKDIEVEVAEEGERLIVKVYASNMLELKVGVSSVMKSLETIEKTLSA